MKICLAQTKSIKGDIQQNIQKHIQFIHIAIRHLAKVIIFPELSITGYEPTLAKELATHKEDSIFDIFQEKANVYQIVIGVGMPIKSERGIHISMIIFQPNKARQSYNKQYLHTDEQPYFIKGEKQVFLDVKNHTIAPAICYEALLSEHAEYAKSNGANVYLASVAKPERGYKKAAQYFPSFAKKYDMPVLMANCVGYCDNFESIGQSSIWNKKGELIGQLNDTEEGLLIMDLETEEMMKKQF